MSECFPPVPLYIVAGIIVAMFTATTKIEPVSSAIDRRDAAFAAFLLIVLSIPFIQLLSILLTTAYIGKCGAVSLNVDRWWVLIFHAVTVFFLPSGAVYWFWNLSNVGRRLQT